MKLSIAVGIILTQSTFASEKEKFLLSSTDRNGGVLNRSAGLGTRSIGKKEVRFPGAPSFASRRLSRALEDSNLVECIPEEIAEARSADVGVLDECGQDKVCVENVESSLGGFCYMAYGIPSFCYQIYPDYAACDCSDFNVTTQTGSITCSHLNGTANMGSSYYGCYDVSAIHSSRYSFKDNMYISRGFCTELFVGDDATNSTKLCMTWGTVSGNPFSFNGSSCELQIDGQACASCTHTMDFSQWPQSSPKVLESKADCSNVVDGLMIDYVDYGHLPIIQACQIPIDGTYCSLCADNEYFDYSDYVTAIPLDGFGSDFTCQDLDWANRSNQLSSDKCVEATVLAQAACCKAKSAAPSTASLSLVSAAGIFLTGTSFMLAMH